MHKKLLIGLTALGCLLSWRSPVHSNVSVNASHATPFDQGRLRLSLQLGGGSYGGDGYFLIGVGVGYFVLKGLVVGAEASQLIGTDPTITKLSPYVTYTITQIPVVHPYAGFFYRHWFAWDSPDADTLGGRGGIQYVLDNRFAFSGGVAYERFISDCTVNCDSFYPEIGVTFAF